MLEEIFQKGARWKHREREIVVIITHVHDSGKFGLGLADNPSADAFEADPFRFLVSGVWTAEDLLLHFEPMDQKLNRYEHLLENMLEDDQFDGE